MANAIVSRLGQQNLAGSTDANFLKVFSGEVLKAFNDVNVMMPLVWTKTLTSGKSAQFPVTGVATAGYHTPGQEIVAQQIAHNERVITVDGKLLAVAFIDEVDELKNHYDTRGEYANQLGYALSNTVDEHLQMEGILGARASAIITGGTAGRQITDSTFVLTGETPRGEADYAAVDSQINFTTSEPGAPTSGDRHINTATGNSSGTSQAMTAGYIYEWNGVDWTETVPVRDAVVLDSNLGYYVYYNGVSAWVAQGTGDAGSEAAAAQAILNALWSAKTTLDDNKAPVQGRFCILRPREYNRLASTVQTTGFALTNKDYMQGGSYTQGIVPPVAGFQIIPSTMVPGKNVLSTDDLYSYHYGDFSRTVGLIGCRQAIGMVKLQSVKSNTWFDERREGSYLKSKLVAGMGYLRPDCLIELKVAAAS